MNRKPETKPTAFDEAFTELEAALEDLEGDEADQPLSDPSEPRRGLLASWLAAHPRLN